MVTTLHNLACSAGVFFKRAICSPKSHVETSRREEEIGLLFLLSPIFHCHKMKDGGYSNITYTNKVSPTQNTPALQAIHNLKQMFYCLISGGGYTQVPYDSLLQRLSQSWIRWFPQYIKHACSNVWSVTAPYAVESLVSNHPDGSLREETAYEILTTGNSSEWRSGLVYFGEDKLLHAIH